jgi:dihydrofolate synthase/folylpolyglutamate synthase
MTEREAIAYIESRKLFGSVLGLRTIGALLAALGHPEKQLRAIHVAGTNGKGSTAHLIAETLAAAGCTAGLYTSPALEYFNERIRIGGAPIPGPALAAVTGRVRSAAAAIVAAGEAEPTVFEIETAIALCYFKAAEVDFAVLEVGLGGRLDATNIIPPPVLAVITRIGLDHTKYLGNTLTAIAGEKAAIIKPGCAVAMAPQPPEAAAVIRKRAGTVGAPLYDAAQFPLTAVRRDASGQCVRCAAPPFDALGPFKLNLKGDHQLENAAALLAAVQALRDQGFAIPDEALLKACACVVFPGRFEVLSQSPLTLIDGAHNLDGVTAFARNVRAYFPGNAVNLYLGMLADKDVDRCLAELVPLADRITALTPDSDRALPAEALAARIRAQYGRPAAALPTVDAALATLDAAPGVLNAFVGSLYLVGKVRTAFFKRHSH